MQFEQFINEQMLSTEVLANHSIERVYGSRAYCDTECVSCKRQYNTAKPVYVPHIGAFRSAIVNPKHLSRIEYTRMDDKYTWVVYTCSFECSLDADRLALEALGNSGVTD